MSKLVKDYYFGKVFFYIYSFDWERVGMMEENYIYFFWEEEDDDDSRS